MSKYYREKYFMTAKGISRIPMHQCAPGWVLFAGLTGRIPSPSGCFRDVSWCPAISLHSFSSPHTGRNKREQAGWVSSSLPHDDHPVDSPSLLLPLSCQKFLFKLSYITVERRICLSSEITRSCRGPAKPSATTICWCSLPTLVATYQLLANALEYMNVIWCKLKQRYDLNLLTVTLKPYYSDYENKIAMGN